MFARQPLCRAFTLRVVRPFPSKNTNLLLRSFSTGSKVSRRIYSIGQNKRGALGINSEDIADEPKLVPSQAFASNLSFEQLSSFGGGNEVLLLAQDEKKSILYGWGLNQYGQLATGDEMQYFGPIKCSSLYKDEGGFLDPSVSVERLTLGGTHTLITTSDHRVYSCGFNGKKLFGFIPIFPSPLGAPSVASQHSKNICKFVQVDALDGQELVSIAAGESHSAVVTQSGAVWVWGAGDFGRLGLRSNRAVKQPKQIPQEYFRDEKIVKVSCGQYFTMVLSSEGTVYVWGRNERSQLGLSGEDSAGQMIAGAQFDAISSPKPLRAFKSPIVNIACGEGTGAAIDSDGRLYYWGRVAQSPVHIEQIQEPVVKVSLGRTHAMALTASNRVYQIGSMKRFGNLLAVDELSLPEGQVCNVVSGSGYSCFLIE